MTELLFLGSIGMPELILIALVVLLFFGGKRIPELMKGLGKGVKGFKEGMNGIEEELNKPLEKEKSEKESAEKDEKSEKEDSTTPQTPNSAK